jgi:hypothetical protein
MNSAIAAIRLSPKESETEFGNLPVGALKKLACLTNNLKNGFAGGNGSSCRSPKNGNGKIKENPTVPSMPITESGKRNRSELNKLLRQKTSIAGLG